MSKKQAQSDQVESEVQSDHPIGPKTPTVPGKIRKATGDFSKAMVWMYGPTKIGKTTTASQFPGAWFWSTEPGQEWLEVYEPMIIHSWNHFLEMCAFVETTRPTKFGDGKPIKTIVIDTADLLYNLCSDQICADIGIDHPGDAPHGKGWSRVGDEFERVITKMRRWPFGMVCISHERERQVKKGIRESSKIEPDIGAGGKRVLEAAADLILYCTTEDRAVLGPDGAVTGAIVQDRIMICHPQAYCTAGGRMVDRMPERIAMFDSKGRPAAYPNLLDAYNKGTK